MDLKAARDFGKAFSKTIARRINVDCEVTYRYMNMSDGSSYWTLCGSVEAVMETAHYLEKIIKAVEVEEYARFDDDDADHCQYAYIRMFPEASLEDRREELKRRVA